MVAIHWKAPKTKNSSTFWNSSLFISKRFLMGWEGLGTGGKGDDRGWDGWMASLTAWPWVWVNSGSWWWTGRPGVLRFMGSQRVRHDWATELNWTLFGSFYNYLWTWPLLSFRDGLVSNSQIRPLVLCCFFSPTC